MMLQPTTQLSNLNIQCNHLKSRYLRASQTAVPKVIICNSEYMNSATMCYFLSSLSGYRQLQHHRGRLGSACRISQLHSCRGEYTCSGSAHRGTDRIPRGADRCQTGGISPHRPQLGRPYRWFRWPKHHHGKSRQDNRFVLLSRGSFRRSRSMCLPCKTHPSKSLSANHPPSSSQRIRR